MTGIAKLGKFGQNCLTFIVVPQVRSNMREKGKHEKKMRMKELKENTLIYIYVCMYI